MTTVLKDLFTSKKFLAALSAIILYLAGRFGFALDPAALDRIFAALLVYVGAQGVADVGKSAALINAAAAPANDNASRAPYSGAGFGTAAAMLAVMLFAIGGGLALPACSWGQVKADAKAGETAAIECTKADAAPILSLLAEFAVDAISSVTDTGAIAWGPLEDKAIAQGLTTGGCAFKRFVAAIQSAPPPASSARSLLAPPDNAAGGRAALARVSAHFGGVTWQVAGG